MKQSKYINDYALEERVDSRGRIRREAVYCGSFYAFRRQGAELKKTKLLFTVLTVLALGAWLGAMLTNAPIVHCWYVLTPMSAMVFPVYYVLASCLRLLTAKEPLTREENDKIGGRFASSAIFLLIFSAISLAGSIIFVIQYQRYYSEEFSAANLAFPAAALVLALCGWLLLSRKKELETLRVENP